MFSKIIDIPNIGKVEVKMDKDGVLTISGSTNVLGALEKYVKSTPTAADDMALAILKRVVLSWE